MGLGAQGRHADAVAMAQEALNIFSNHADDNRYTDMASALNTLASEASQAGQHQRALSAARYSVSIFRKLHTENQEAFQRSLAGGLSDLSTMLRLRDKRLDAEVIAREAIALFRSFVKSDSPDRDLSGLAMCLDNLAALLSELKRQNEALPLALEAVDLHRQLTRRRPDAFESALARNLHNLSRLYWQMRDRASAIANIEEAISLRQKYAASNPEAFQAELALSKQLRDFMTTH